MSFQHLSQALRHFMESKLHATKQAEQQGKGKKLMSNQARKVKQSKEAGRGEDWAERMRGGRGVRRGLSLILLILGSDRQDSQAANGQLASAGYSACRCQQEQSRGCSALPSRCSNRQVFVIVVVLSPSLAPLAPCQDRQGQVVETPSC